MNVFEEMNSIDQESKYNSFHKKGGSKKSKTYSICLIFFINLLLNFVINFIILIKISLFS